MSACLVLAFCIYLAVGAYLGSKEVGAGAAQGDLGFFLLLLVVTPVIVSLASLLWWVERLVTRQSPPGPARFSIVGYLSLASVAVIAWNWFFLLVLWRA